MLQLQNRKPLSGFQLIPRFQNKVAGAVLAVLLFLLFFEDAEGVAREIGAICTIGIENEMKFVVLKSLKGSDHQQLMLRKSFPDTDFGGNRKPARPQGLRNDMPGYRYRQRPNDPP